MKSCQFEIKVIVVPLSLEYKLRWAFENRNGLDQGRSVLTSRLFIWGICI
jgi:hypothetical protein